MKLRINTCPLAAFTALALTGTSLADGALITGDIIYRERIALPPNAIAEISLVDVSRADAEAVVLANQTIDPAGQVPIGFSLAFDPSAINGGNTYALQARITAGDELWFINDTRIDIAPLTHTGPVEVMVVRPANEKDLTGATLGDTRWTLVSIGEEPAAPDVETTLNIGTDNAIGGSGGCNVYGGSISYTGDAGISIREVFSTMMACADPAMAQERNFFNALNAAAQFSVEGDTLTLSDEEGTALVVLKAQ